MPGRTTVSSTAGPRRHGRRDARRRRRRRSRPPHAAAPAPGRSRSPRRPATGAGSGAPGKSRRLSGRSGGAVGAGAVRGRRRGRRHGRRLRRRRGEVRDLERRQHGLRAVLAADAAREARLERHDRLAAGRERARHRLRRGRVVRAHLDARSPARRGDAPQLERQRRLARGQREVPVPVARAQHQPERASPPPRRARRARTCSGPRRPPWPPRPGTPSSATRAPATGLPPGCVTVPVKTKRTAPPADARAGVGAVSRIASRIREGRRGIGLTGWSAGRRTS